jgi:hypothetical protein
MYYTQFTVEYVKVCPTYGPGFFYIPGTDTCLKVGGNVWAEVNFAQRFMHDQNPLGTRTSGKVSLDARTNTEYGLLRTVVEPQFSTRTGSDNSGSAGNEGLNFTGNSYNKGGVNGLGIGSNGKQMQFNNITFLQFGGLTVGHMESFFSNFTAPQSNIGLDGRDQRDLTSTVAYTASLGNGITATVALEDGTLVNRQGIYDTNFRAAKYADATHKNVGGVGYGSNRLPDYIAVLGVDQAWGKFSVSGAIHSINTSDNELGSLALNTSSAGLTAANMLLLGSGTQGTGASGLAGTNQSAVGTQYGYALEARTKINLPMIGAGDYLFLSGIFTSGANAFSLRNAGAGDVTNQNNNTLGIGRVGVGMNDIIVSGNTVYKAQVWGVSGEFGHQFTPTVGAYLGGSYTALGWSSGAQSAVRSVVDNWVTPSTVSDQNAANPANVVIANFGVVWTPVKGFKITPDVEYIRIQTKYASNQAMTAEGAPKKSESAVIGRIKIQRDF